MVRFEAFLQQYFRLSEADSQLISGYFEVRLLRKNDFFIREGRVCRQAGLILEGVMRYFGYQENGEEQTCYFATDHDYVIDPFSFPGQVPATFNLQLVTDCQVAVISYHRNKELTRLYPGWTGISAALVQRALGEFVNQKKMISYDAAKRYNYFVETYPRFAQEVPLQYIASYLGITQPSLSRLRKQLTKKIKLKVPG